MRSPRALERFELSMLGGPVERRYRKLRPEVERLPWGSLAASLGRSRFVDDARIAWTEAAFQEHRTGAACAATLQALIAARAPLDLIAVASRFPLDEMVHVELCARLAMELGGGAPLLHDPAELIPAPTGRSIPLHAARLVVQYFCVGEAISIPLLHGTWRAATHPLVKGVLGRIVKDEAAHGQFGWTFLDWIDPQLTEDDRRELSEVAGETIAELERRWSRVQPRPETPDAAHALGWMETKAYLTLARQSLQTQVLEPLAARGIRPR